MYFKHLFTIGILIFMLNACGGSSSPTSPTNNGTTENNGTTPSGSIGSNGGTQNNNGTTHPKDINITLLKPLFKEINVGLGLSGSYPFMGNNGKVVWLSSADLILDDNVENNINYQTIKNFDITQFDILQKHLKNTKFIEYWFTKGWSENWYDITKIQKLIDNGYVPVFNYWYFGDTLGGGFPTKNDIVSYHQDNSRVASFLSKLNGQFFVIMEPEFNKAVVTDAIGNQHDFATIISDAIDIIKSKNNKALFSLCMSDTGRRDSSEVDPKCGYENCGLGDINEWHLPEIVYNDLAKKIDFISFQEMVGQFHRDSKNPGTWNSPNPISSTEIGTGISFLPKRISNFSKYLRNKYAKPVFLSYMSVATAAWNDANNDNVIQNSELDLNGWEMQASKVYSDLMKMKQELLNNNLFGIVTMSLFDDTRHDIGGYQYFMNNEYHLGIVKTSAKDIVDKYLFGDIVFKGSILDTLFPIK